MPRPSISITAQLPSFWPMAMILPSSIRRSPSSMMPMEGSIDTMVAPRIRMRDKLKTPRQQAMYRSRPPLWRPSFQIAKASVVTLLTDRNFPCWQADPVEHLLGETEPLVNVWHHPHDRCTTLHLRDIKDTAIRLGIKKRRDQPRRGVVRAKDGRKA